MHKAVKKYIITIFTICRLTSSAAALVSLLVRSCTEQMIGIKILHIPQRAWFTFAKSRFLLCGIEDDQQRFDHVLSALPAEMVLQVIDLVDTLRTENQYE